MKVVNITPINFDDSCTDSRDSSFERFKQAMLSENEFNNDDGRNISKNSSAEFRNNDNSHQPSFCHMAFPFDFQGGPSSKQSDTATSTQISPDKVMDIDSWGGTHQSEIFEKARNESDFNFNVPTVGGDVTPKVLFDNEPKGKATLKDPPKYGNEAANATVGTAAVETRKDNWWDPDFDDRQDGKGEDDPEFVWNKTSFDNKKEENKKGKPSALVNVFDNVPKEGNGECKLDSNGFPTFTSDCTNKGQQKAKKSDCSKPSDLSTVDQHSIRSRSTKWQSSTSSGGGTNRFVPTGCMSLDSFSNYFNETEDQVDNHSTKQTASNQDRQYNQIDNNTSQEKNPPWKRLFAKVPIETRAKVTANILQVKQAILACHEPNSSFVDTVEVHSISDNDPSTTRGNANECSFECTENKLNDSVFSSSMLSTSQAAMSIPSDASTPIRRQNITIKKTEPSSSASSSSVVRNLATRQRNHSNDDDKDCDSTLKLCVDYYEQSAFQTLMSNLKGNLRITELHVLRSCERNAGQSRNTEDIGLLFKTIRSLSNLEVLNLENFVTEEIQFVALTQWQNQNLNTIRIHLSSGAISKRLLNILAELPALRNLTLEMNKSFPFYLLLNSHTLESLAIIANDFNIDTLDAREMIEKLPKNQTLKKLTIEPPLQPRTFKLLASAFCKNTRIEHLRFSLLPGNSADTNDAIRELAHTLKTNKFLKAIWNINHSNIHVKECTCDAVMEALSENYMIEDFLVFDETSWFRNRKDKILKENKAGINSIIPQIFNCVDADGESTRSD